VKKAERVFDSGDDEKHSVSSIFQKKMFDVENRIFRGEYVSRSFWTLNS
jgi:hypothetical protein